MASPTVDRRSALCRQLYEGLNTSSEDSDTILRPAQCLDLAPSSLGPYAVREDGEYTHMHTRTPARTQHTRTHAHARTHTHTHTHTHRTHGPEWRRKQRLEARHTLGIYIEGGGREGGREGGWEDGRGRWEEGWGDGGIRRRVRYVAGHRYLTAAALMLSHSTIDAD